MTDRERLKMAAKAAGIRYTVEDDEYYKTRKFFGLWLVYDDEPSNTSRRYWNPLTDDGDALRLAVKLNLFVQINSSTATAWKWRGQNWYEHASDYAGDMHAATRRAIVRAAAEIGRSMK